MSRSAPHEIPTRKTFGPINKIRARKSSGPTKFSGDKIVDPWNTHKRTITLDPRDPWNLAHSSKNN